MPSDSDSHSNVTTLDLTIKLDGDQTAVKADEIFDFEVEADLDHPDMASLVLSNVESAWSTKAKLGAELELLAGRAGDNDAKTIFKGEVIGIEPTFEAHTGSRVTLRALNQLHRLSRGKKSRTFQNVKDSDIVNKLASENGMSSQVDSPASTVFEHVYQHNQTDLEFLRLRAARIGCEVLVDDKKLIFRPRKKNESEVELGLGTTLEKFNPRLSAANQVTEVTVHGWDWKTKKAIVGQATQVEVNLSSKTGLSMAQSAFGKAKFIGVDIPVASQEEANSIAKGILRDRTMSFVTGEGVCKGDPRIKPGLVVKITVGDPRFDGKYFITAVRQRYNHGGPAQGFRTEFRVASDGVES